MKDISKFTSVTARRSQIYFADQFRPLGITSGQFMIVAAVCARPGQSQDQIADFVLMDKSTVTKTLAQLEESGMVSRQGNEEDKRVTNVFPTDLALKIYPQITQAKARWHQKLLEGIPEHRWDEVGEILEILMENAVRALEKGDPAP